MHKKSSKSKHGRKTLKARVNTGWDPPHSGPNHSMSVDNEINILDHSRGSYNRQGAPFEGEDPMEVALREKLQDSDKSGRMPS